MLSIKKHQIIIEMDRNDLWQLATILRNGIINECKVKWIHFYKGDQKEGFLDYVRSQNHHVFQYIEKIYSYLDRYDLIDLLMSDLSELFEKPT